MRIGQGLSASGGLWWAGHYPRCLCRSAGTARHGADDADVRARAGGGADCRRLAARSLWLAIGVRVSHAAWPRNLDLDSAIAAGNPASDRASVDSSARCGRRLRRALRSSAFLLLVAIVALNFGGIFLYIAAIAGGDLSALHYGANDFWRLFVPLVAGMMAGTFLSGRLAGRLSHAHRRSIWVMA